MLPKVVNSCRERVWPFFFLGLEAAAARDGKSAGAAESPLEIWLPLTVSCLRCWRSSASFSSESSAHAPGLVHALTVAAMVLLLFSLLFWSVEIFCEFFAFVESEWTPVTTTATYRKKKWATEFDPTVTIQFPDFNSISFEEWFRMDGTDGVS